MFDIPGFDPKTMTDEEMFHRQQDIARKLVYAQRFGLATEMIGQFQMMSQAIDAERRERNFAEVWKMREAMFPEIIETDPDLRAASISSQPRPTEDKPQKNQNPRNLGGMRRPVASPTPMAPPPEPAPPKPPHRSVTPKDTESK